jgi:hypothetical protein
MYCTVFSHEERCCTVRGVANFFFQIYGVCIFASHAIPDTQGAAIETKKAEAFFCFDINSHKLCRIQGRFFNIMQFSCTESHPHT